MTYYICFIKSEHHIRACTRNVALLKKVARLESQVADQDFQISHQKGRIKKLSQDKRTLVEEVRKHKWDHILTKSELTRTKHKLEHTHKEIADLKAALRIAHLPANSSNSSHAPSTDMFKPKRGKNYSLRKKTRRKPGGQPSHKGSTLEFCTDAPNQEIEHTVDSCSVHYTNVPADNNGSERAIRCIKVKQKVSGQFKTPKGAHKYAMIRSITDTMINQNKNVHEGLAGITSFVRD